MPAAWVSAGAAAVSAGSQLANSGGGSTGTTATPANQRYMAAGQSAASNWLPYYASGANPGISGLSQQGFSAAPNQYVTNQNFLENAQYRGNEFGSGNFIGSNPAYSYLGGMAQGGATNPWLDATYDQAAGKVRAGLDAQFSGAGRYGSGGHQNAVGNALGDLATSLYGGQYNADQNRALQAGATLGQIGQGERQQQLSGLGLSSVLSGAQTANLGGLLNAGTYRDQLLQRDHYGPLDAMQRYQNIVSGNSGGTETKPYFQDNSGAITAAGSAFGKLGEQAYNWWNQPSGNLDKIGGIQPDVVYGH